MNVEYLNEVMEDVRNKVLKHFAKEAIENLKNGKKKEPSKITGSLAIDIMRGYNQITYVDNEIDYALTCKSKEIDDDEFHCYMFTRNCTNHYLMDIKDKLNGDIKKSLMIVDMPYNTYRTSKEALKNAKQIMRKN